MELSHSPLRITACGLFTVDLRIVLSVCDHIYCNHSQHVLLIFFISVDRINNYLFDHFMAIPNVGESPLLLNFNSNIYRFQLTKIFVATISPNAL